MSIEVWPVIHVDTLEQSLENARLAAQYGAAGVFIISHNHRDEEVDFVGAQIRHRQYKGFKVGANYLSEVSPGDATMRALARSFHAAWVDNAGFYNGIPSPSALDLVRVRGRIPIFCGFAFKGQRPDEHPEASALSIARVGELIPTTSGSATGSAPELRKIESIRKSLDGLSASLPLAVASGLTPDNVGNFRSLITHALVATGISSDFYNFDERKLARFMEECR